MVTQEGGISDMDDNVKIQDIMGNSQTDQEIAKLKMATKAGS
jgi:hypothetical protein